MNKLPMGWVWVNLGDVCEYIRGVTYNKSQSSLLPIEGYTPIFRANNIQNGKIVDDDLVFVQDDLIKKQQLLLKNDILVAMSSGSKSVVGKTAFISENINCSFGAFCGVLRPNSIINANLVSNFTQSLDYRNRISGLSAGANINNLKPAHFYEIKFPLPPKAEQDHIATLLDNHLSQVATIRQKLNDILPIIKQFRQSVLAQAVSGKLTNNEQKIGWKLSKIDDEFKCIDGDRGKNYPKKEDYLNQGYCLFLSTKNVRKFGFDFQEKTYISEEKHKTLRSGKLERGDLIITTRGTLGNIASYDCSVSYDIVRINSGMLILRKKNEDIDNDFMMIYLASPSFQKIIKKQKSGSAQPQLPAKVLKEFRLTIPPLPEQQQIVTEVERLFALADNIEKQVNEALERVENLTQSILHQAFIGNLSADWRACNADLITGEHSAAALLDTLKANAPNKTKKPKKSPPP